MLFFLRQLSFASTILLNESSFPHNTKNYLVVDIYPGEVLLTILISCPEGSKIGIFGKTEMVPLSCSYKSSVAY